MPKAMRAYWQSFIPLWHRVPDPLYPFPQNLLSPLQADYLASLGVNAVELLPVFEYDELEFQRHKNPRDHMTNIWGYSHMNFFAPMSRFAAGGGGPAAAAREFKEMVKKCEGGWGRPAAAAREFKEMVKARGGLCRSGGQLVMDQLVGDLTAKPIRRPTHVTSPSSLLPSLPPSLQAARRRRRSAA